MDGLQQIQSWFRKNGMDASASSAVKTALAIYGVYSLLKNVTSNLTLDKLMNMIPGVQGAVDVRICGN